ncbi:MAG: ABC transporter ATP-binding protein [Desulfocapsa sp.]|nr:ABC transporter ATP-binding protein [Desulfocapsa sp.]
MLEIKNLTTKVGDFCLDSINLSVDAGKCHAVLGPSGSGKSTLLNAILGVLPITAGCVWLDGEDMSRRPIEQRNLGYVPQHLGLFPHLSVRDNLLYSVRARKRPRIDWQPLFEKLVEVTGIGDLLERRISTLSGGERQRVALVRALMGKSRLVLLDEPFTALNESLRQELWWLVKELQRERELTVLLITHDLTEAYFLAENITVLINGRQEQNGETVNVYHSPATLAVAGFLGIKNLFSATVVHRSENHIVVDCTVLNHRMRLSGNAPVGAKIRVGILPENVALRDALHPPRQGEILLTGRVQLIQMKASVDIRFENLDRPLVVHISASQRLVKRFMLMDEQVGVTIGLPETALFWIPDY